MLVAMLQANAEDEHQRSSAPVIERTTPPASSREALAPAATAIRARNRVRAASTQAARSTLGTRIAEAYELGRPSTATGPCAPARNTRRPSAPHPFCRPDPSL